MRILVSGGLGFIGSHTVIALIEGGHQVVIADNLSNAKIETLATLQKIVGQTLPFYQIDVTDEVLVRQLFDSEHVQGIIHFAGYKAVGESVQKPLDYYQNNLMSTIVLAKMIDSYRVKHFVFSSSATVYGDQASPFHENMTLAARTNPYGETKAMCERILQDVAAVHPQISISILRYFNPIGAHQSGLIGEDPNGIPNNLLPYILKVASGELDQLSVYGDDYPTRDGTGVRDYIHVVDLARGHVKAIEGTPRGYHIYNLGTGKGTSVLEMIDAFKRVNQVELPYKIVGRRAGDIAEYYADASKAKHELDWQARYSLADMVRDAWRFQKKQATRC